MKKILLVVAVAGIMTSCKDKKKTEETTTTTPTTEQTTTPPTTTTTSDPAPTTNAGDVPSFKDADVQAYAEAYANLADAYKKAAENKDLGKLADLSKTGMDLAAKTSAMTQKLIASPEEAKKLSDFIMAKSKEITEASKKLSGM